MKKIICVDCNKELPLDSKFCQYCGSKNINTIEEKNEEQKEEKRSFKKCNNCNKELPLDSKFCQYCGSDNITEIKPEETKTKENAGKNDSANYKLPFIITLIVAISIFLLTISSYYSQNEEIAILKEEVKITQEEASDNKLDASKYSSVSKLANLPIYSDFRADTYFVKGTVATVNIYCNFDYYGEYTVYPSIEGNGINITWGEWSGYGSNNHVQMFITCSSTRYGVITLTNSVNSHTIKIFVTGS